MATAVEDQENILKMLIKWAGIRNLVNKPALDEVNKYEEFSQAVPIRDYEEMKPYIELIKEGKHNVLWKGSPSILPKHQVPPVVPNIFRSPKIQFPIISILPGMPCFVIWRKRETLILPMVK